jgi:K+-sensing histidine kinase KdpD
LSEIEERRLIIAVVDGVSDSTGLLDQSAAMAECLSAQWTAVHVNVVGDESDAEVVGTAFDKAMKLGADIIEIPGHDKLDALSELISERRPLYTFIERSLTAKRRIVSRRNWQIRLLQADLPTTFVLVEPHSDRTQIAVPDRSKSNRTGWVTYLKALLAVILTIPFILALERLMGPSGLSLIFLLPVIAVGERLGTRPALLASVSSGICFWIFVLRGHSLFPQAAAQAFFVTSALVAVGSYIAMITGKMRARLVISDRVAKQNGRLASFGIRLAQADSWITTSQEICSEMNDAFDVQAALFHRTADGFDVITSAPRKSPALGPLDIAARETAWEEGEETGAGTKRLNSASWHFHPLETSLGRLALLGVARDDGRNPIDEKNALLYRSLLNQASLACERLHLENLKD